MSVVLSFISHFPLFQSVKDQARSNLYRAGATTLWETPTSEYAKVGVVVIATEYGRTTSKLTACYSPEDVADVN